MTPCSGISETICKVCLPVDQADDDAGLGDPAGIGLAHEIVQVVRVPGEVAVIGLAIRRLAIFAGDGCAATAARPA